MKYNVVITSGGTSEKIDNVRKITNSSSGKLGSIIANELIKHKRKINKIYYLCAKSSIKPKNKKIEIVYVSSASDLLNKVENILKENKIHFFIHSMAVSDYEVDYVSTVENLLEESKNKDITNVLLNPKNKLIDSKISSNENNLIIKLKKTPKIISNIKKFSPNTFLIGFKLLDNVTKEKLISTALKLKNENLCNLVVANDYETVKSGNHTAYIIKDENNYQTAFGKNDIAKKLVKEIL